MHPPLRFDGIRRVIGVGVAVVLVVIASAPSASAAQDPLAEVQARITAAQEAADNAAAAYDAAQTQYYQLQNDVRATRSAIASLRVSQQRLVEIVHQRAVALYTGAGATGLEVLRTSGDVLDASRYATLGAAANARSNVAIGQLRATTDDLNAREESLRSQLDDAKRALDDIRSQQRELERAVNSARRAERQLRAQLERERRVEEYAALVREAQAAARTRAAQLADAARDAAAAARTRAAQRADAARDAAAAADDSPSEPAPVIDDGPPQIIGRGNWVCPVQGGVSFTDSWGAPRSGGRSHKGVDMFAARGTPSVAVVAGSVFFQSEGLGGLAAYVQGNDGNTYYYAHLDDWVGGARSVSAGELIGHVGDTGTTNAPPQLHFEIRPGGPNGTQINPYPTVSANC